MESAQQNKFCMCKGGQDSALKVRLAQLQQANLLWVQLYACQG